MMKKLFQIGLLLTAGCQFASAQQQQLIINGEIEMSGGTAANPVYIVVGNSATNGVVANSGGFIYSENEFNMLAWNIGTNTGSYTVPFGYSPALYIPVTCNIGTAGVGSGMVKFSTYHGATWDNSTYEPSDVTNMTDFLRANYSNDAVDRFWVLDAAGYTTKPSPTITFSYIRSGASSEIAVPNYILETDLIAQRFNSTLSKWDDWYGLTHTNVTAVNTGTISSGLLPASGFYRSWTLFNDSTLLTSVTPVVNVSSVIVYPNPSVGNFTVSGLTQGQVVELYNDIGQQLTKTVVDNATMHFDISNKANGIYLLRIQNKDGSIVTQKKIEKTQ